MPDNFNVVNKTYTVIQSLVVVLIIITIVLLLSQNWGQLKEANTRQPETKNKTGGLKFTELSESISGAFVDEVPISGPVS